MRMGLEASVPTAQYCSQPSIDIILVAQSHMPGIAGSDVGGWRQGCGVRRFFHSPFTDDERADRMEAGSFSLPKYVYIANTTYEF
jgi:hypothetical protein